MSDAMPLPPHPDLDQYDKLAEDFRAAAESKKAGAVRDLALRWAEHIAKLQGREITSPVLTPIESAAERLAPRWDGTPTEEAARLFLARAHGFSNWQIFAAHIEALAHPGSPIASFESAADAVTSGNAELLRKLLQQSSGLALARSTREHGSTLLHYVSANGVEDFRQKTPPNIIEIANMLLLAGSEVNAESNAYGGRATTLSRVATSVHPEKAGVQIPLLELLIRHGAMLDGPGGASTVNACLHNGRGAAATFLAERGAKLDLEGAAGVRRMDMVQRLLSSASQDQLRNGFAWACEFGHTEVVSLLLRNGVPADAALAQFGQTGLHWAAYGGHPDTVRLLLASGAPVNPRDKRFGGTPLEWALHAWRTDGREVFYEVVASLVRSGAEPEPRCYEGPDQRMLSALRGQS